MTLCADESATVHRSQSLRAISRCAVLALASSLLVAGKLKVHRRCKDLINEVPGYSWNPKAQLLGKDEPIKVADHSIDAGLRYLPKTTEAIWRQYIDLAAAA